VLTARRRSRLAAHDLFKLVCQPISGAALTDVSDRPWSEVSKASYSTANEYCGACIIDENAPGSPKTKSRCKLPVYEPAQLGGLLNRNAVRAAAERLVQSRGGLTVAASERQDAAKRLVTLFVVIGEKPPHSLIALAGTVGVQAPATGSWGALEP
jgi:hypothetical protein